MAQFYINNFLLQILPQGTPSRITAAYFISYVIAIWLQHLLHAVLVYGWRTSYVKGLLSTYFGYAGSLFASVPINYVLVNFGGLGANQAYVLTIALTGIANYFLLNSLLGGNKESTDKD